MNSNTQENDGRTMLEQAWEALQDTSSYAERFCEGRSTFEAEAQHCVQIFCGNCGFWVEDGHQCPAEVCA
jgi:hypothetical protein